MLFVVEGLRNAVKSAKMPFNFDHQNEPLYLSYLLEIYRQVVVPTILFTVKFFTN